MKLKFTGMLVAFLAMTVFVSCGDDDDDGGLVPVEIRDEAMQAIDDDNALVAFLTTHAYNYEEFANTPAGFDFRVRIDTIQDPNAGLIPLINQVEEIQVQNEDVNYTLYVLKAVEGQGERPTFADSTLVNYRGTELDRMAFDAVSTPIWFDLPAVVAGFREGLTEFRGGTGATSNPDGSITYENFGIGAVFMPSGLGYFNGTAGGAVSPYAPLVFSFQLIDVVETDHDDDGILSQFEDLDGDRRVSDADDDLDGDGVSAYLDADDDGDGIATRDENADPNGDGNPDDALDSDGDGTPDYLDADS